MHAVWTLLLLQFYCFSDTALMRENPDTSLKLLRLLADEPYYPSRLTPIDIRSQLKISD